MDTPTSENTTLLARLESLAFHTCNAADANEELARLRDERELEYGRAIAYEIVAKEGGALDPSLLPRLAVHLEAKRIQLTSCPELFAGIFAGETLYFVDGPDLVAALLSHAGLSPSQVPGYVAAWQRAEEGNTRLALPALPPPAEDDGAP